MSQEKLQAKIRHLTGKKANRQLRLLDKIPAILYGPGQSINLELEESSTRKLISELDGTHRLVPLIVNDENGKEEEHQVLVQEIQKHPFKRKLVHLDFRVLNPERPITLKVPLRTSGEAIGIKKGGALQMIVREVPVSCLPTNIPEYVEVDVSNLDFHQTLRIEEIKYPESVTPAAKQNYSVATIIGRKAEATEE